MIEDNNNIKNNTITANAAKYDNERYCYGDSYSERKINLITKGLEPRYANVVSKVAELFPQSDVIFSNSND